MIFKKLPYIPHSSLLACPQMLDTMAKVSMLADEVAIFGNLDVMFGKIDK